MVIKRLMKRWVHSAIGSIIVYSAWYSSMFFCHVLKGDNYRDFLFASLGDETPSIKVLLLKERICFSLRKFFLIKSWHQFDRESKNENGRVAYHVFIKKGNMDKSEIFFKNILCDPSLEPPRQGGSNERSQCKR